MVFSENNLSEGKTILRSLYQLIGKKSFVLITIFQIYILLKIKLNKNVYFHKNFGFFRSFEKKYILI